MHRVVMALMRAAERLPGFHGERRSASFCSCAERSAGGGRSPPDGTATAARARFRPLLSAALRASWRAGHRTEPPKKLRQRAFAQGRRRRMPGPARSSRWQTVPARGPATGRRRPVPVPRRRRPVPVPRRRGPVPVLRRRGPVLLLRRRPRLRTVTPRIRAAQLVGSTLALNTRVLTSCLGGWAHTRAARRNARREASQLPCEGRRSALDGRRGHAHR